jgi:hypothetical protein
MSLVPTGLRRVLGVYGNEYIVVWGRCNRGTGLLLASCVGGDFLTRNALVRIESSPSGALATSEYGDSCKTPCSLRLPTDRGESIHISKAGYEDYETYVGSHFSKVKAGFGTAADTAYYIDDPSPVVAAVDVLEAALNSKSKYRYVSSYNVYARLISMDGAAAAPSNLNSGGETVNEKGVILLK